MTTAHFTALDIEFDLPFGIKYNDNGFVQSIPWQIRKTYMKHLDFEKAIEYDKKDDERTIGKHMVRIGVFGFEHHHIFYLDMGDAIENIAIRAHEEAHALQMLNGGRNRHHYIGNTLDMIAEDFPKAKHISNPFGTTAKNNERIAEICGAYATIKNYGRLPKISNPETREEIKRLFL